MKSAQRKNESPVLGEQETYSEDEIAQISSRVLRMCLSRGISRAQADDVVQDVWLWLARSGWPRLALSPGWIVAVAWNFVLRDRRRTYSLRRREEPGLHAVEEPSFLPDHTGFENEDILNWIERSLPDIEKKLLALIRRGNTFACAAAALHIPRGSRSYHLHRIIDLARRKVGGPPPTRSSSGGTTGRHSRQPNGIRH